MRTTHALVMVAMAMMESPDAQHWGYDLAKRAGVRSGVLYPMLTRMLDEGWLTDGWEEQTAVEGGRPPRRYYELTDTGRMQLGAVLRAASSERRFASLNVGWA